MNIGESIRHYRKKRGMTQAQLADKLGVTVQAVSKWETGSGIPDTALLIPLARTLAITTDTLLCYQDKKLEYKRRWEHALRHSGDNQSLQAVCLEILEEDPENTEFLFRAAMNEKFLAEETDDAEKRHFHWTMSCQYTKKLLRLDPPHEPGKEHLVEVLSALGLDDEAIAQAHRCADSSRALLLCLKGDALRRHRQKRIDQKFQSLLNEIEQAGMPEVTEALIRAAIPDENYQHYGFFLFHHGWEQSKSHYADGNGDAVMDELHSLFALARKLDDSKADPRFSAEIFDLLEGFQNPPGIPGFMEQFIHETEYLFPQLAHREDYQVLLTTAKEIQKGTA